MDGVGLAEDGGNLVAANDTTALVVITQTEPIVVAFTLPEPNLAWSHDVSGYSPGPENTFEEGRKAVPIRY